MKKCILLVIFGVLLLCLFFKQYAVQFVWVNPDVNTKVFPYISNAVKEIDQALDYTEFAMSAENIKIIYKNAYGSGFLKHNPLPNDLDYSVGVYLGEYEYNGHNSSEFSVLMRY